jgi:hypothetical protein
MKTTTLLRRAVLVPSLAASLAASLPTMAATFTNDTHIGIHDTSFDGQAIVVGPCTLTVDGSHAFASLQVLAGGTLTHTFSTNGLLNGLLAVAGEHHVLSGTNPVTLGQPMVTVDTIVVTDLSGATNYHLGTDYQVQTNQAGNAAIARLAGSTIPDGATISVSYEALVPLVPAGLNLEVTNGVVVQAGGAINADGRGYGGGYGPGAGTNRTVSSPYVFTSGGGGGYGGSGGASSGLAAGGMGYGSITTPSNNGSGGGLGPGPGGPGGGAIHLNIGGQLQLDGQITANGAEGVGPRSGGGSGGSIWLSAAACSGAGSISANGGAGEPRDGGGGGGGRIAVYTGATQATASPFAGSMSARGGAGATYGGAGTIYLEGTSHPEGLVQIDNGGPPGTTILASGSGFFDLAISGGAVVSLNLSSGGPLALNNVMIGSNSWLSALPAAGSITYPVQMTISSNMTIEAGGGVLTDGQGYAGGAGPGAGSRYASTTNSSGGGGGHGGPGGGGLGGGAGGGGLGGGAGGGAYGFISEPREAGSGGGSGQLVAHGGAGGGVVQLTVNGSLVVDGAVSANGIAGTSPGDGGGAGGSVWLTVGSLSGAGVIAASGAPGQLPGGGGGGGGRIAIHYGTNSFAGSLRAQGGPGAFGGGAGTIYTMAQASSAAQLLVDNGGLPTPTNTPLSSVSGAVDLAVVGGARANPFGTSPNASGSLRNLEVGSNSWLSYSPPNGLTALAVTLTVSSNATIEAGGGIVLDGLGSGPGDGQVVLAGSSTLSGYVGTGGGNGGVGGASAFGGAGGISYGTFSSPQQPGSGGAGLPNATGGAGGGALLLSVGGGLVLDGIISADGASGVAQGAGGGSGGSVRLTVGSLSGGGLISANGGSADLPYGGGGGGGRIAVLSSTGGAPFAGFTGNLRARGGAGAHYGGAGTIFLQPAGSAPGQLVVENGGEQGGSTPLVLASSSPVPNLAISSGAAVSLAYSSSIARIANLQIGSNSWLVCSNSAQSFPQTVLTQPFTLAVVSNATVQAGGGISWDGQGNLAGEGAGAGARSLVGTGGAGGGGYGGFGGNGLYGAVGGSAYGSTAAPTNPGSGGGPNTELGQGAPFGAGGGALKMTVGGTLALDGKLSADGEPGLASGGGSGGSLWLTARALTGAGLISANGGAGDGPSGGGGGGRVALYFATNGFKGVVSARGGAGYNYGGAGTIYLLASNGPSAQVIVDNGGVPGTGSLLSLSGGSPLDLTVSGGAQANLAGSFAITNLLIGPSSSLSYSNPTASALMNVLGNATIQAGGALSVDGLGYPAGQGPGPGHNLSAAQTTTGGGGGYGGDGGSSAFGAAGGPAYGSVSFPSANGSGGAAGSTEGTSGGGAGGGALHLAVSGALAVNGSLSANGADALGPGGGGGSGGSLWLTVGALSGAGVISANGGAGDLPDGGAGGGGRIALYYRTNSFTGTISAHGGPGATYGGAGTVYLSTQAAGQATVPELLVENGGWAGASTPLISPESVDLTVGAGALVTASGGIIHSLVIQSNAWLGQVPVVNQEQGVPSALQFTVTADATIQAGGGITLDGAGYPYGQGPGAGHAQQAGLSAGLPGSGAGHGGLGGAGVSNAPAGAAYGSLLEPVDPGSGGGGYTFGIVAAGSAGGGALQLRVAGSLVLNGRISADGGGATYDGFGGGSGGSLWLSAGNLSGNGVISADGGPGDLLEGGGGGGGRIAVDFGTNTFTGSLSAHGGDGANPGGAGTIYSQAAAAAAGPGYLVIDNGGLAGTNTPLSTPVAFHLTVSGQAVAYPLPSAPAPLPSTPALLVSSLLVDSGGVLTCLAGQTNLDLTVLGQATVGSNGWISADAKGYSGTNGGPGAGLMTDGYSGSGAGYGGAGGASLGGTPGGATYGSAQQPVDWGSRGGLSPAYAGFCQGGGAILLRVGGPLTLNGKLTANGNAALFEGAGGGSGGSVWVTTSQIEGSGLIAAAGGAGDPDEGGGGGGGRIALYCPTNNFAGSIAAPGGPGAFPGANGTVFLSAVLLPPPGVLAQSPSGIVSFAVSNVDLTLSSPLDLNSVSGADFLIITPTGVLPQAEVTLSTPAPYTLQAAFPPQTEAGYYEISLGPQVQNIYGLPLGAAYAGSFVVLPPSLSGRITDTNGLPVPYVTLEAGGSLLPGITDSNGLYSLEVPPGWSGTVTPVKAQALFLPASRSYTNLTANLANQNFLMVAPAAPALTAQARGANLQLGWQGLSGASHQLLWSTNFVDWLPCGPALLGTNGPMRVAVPLGAEPAKFFRISTSQ